MEHHTQHFTLSFYACIAYVVPLLCSFVLVIRSLPQLVKARGSRLVRNDSDIMLFRKPLPLRRTTLAIAGFFFLLFLDTLTLAAEARNPLPAYFMCIVPLSFPLMFLYLSGPDDIRLDGSQRTFEHTIGFPWKPVTKFGTFDSIKGISFDPVNGVQLILEKPGTLYKAVTLSSTGTRAAAEALIEELKRKYGFPIVPYPQGRKL